MTIKLVAHIQCDHESCTAQLEDDDPFIDIYYDVNDYGDKYATAEPSVRLRDGWDNKPLGGSYLSVRGDFCPNHKGLYPKERK